MEVVRNFRVAAASLVVSKTDSCSNVVPVCIVGSVELSVELISQECHGSLAMQNDVQETAKLPVAHQYGKPFYRAMHFSAMRGIGIACRPSVCPSVRLSVCDVGGL